MKKVLLATNNKGKVERFRKLVGQLKLDVELVTPKEMGIAEIDVVENGATLAENAEIKARAYFGLVDMPIVANDTGFWVFGEGLVEAPKREALQGSLEHELTQEEISKAMIEFWKEKATKNGGKVDAAWVEAFVLIDEKGSAYHADSRRDIILTDTVFGEPHPQMPVRCLYISKATNKPALQHTQEEEILEMEPIMKALETVLKNI